MNLYLAGPDIFFPDAPAIADRKRALCREYGFTPLHPLDGALPVAASPEAVADLIYDANRARMLQADLVVADLTPFRGPSADPGTVFELGFMTALGRPAFAYSHTAALLRARTVAALPGAHAGPDGRWFDPDGAEIEDFGLADNLMISSALRRAGRTLMVPLPVVGGGERADPFERCLAAARAALLR